MLPEIYDDRSLLWRNNERDGVSRRQPYDCLLIRLFGRRSKKTSKLRVTGLCAGNSPVTGEFPAQRASNAEMFPFDDVIIWPDQEPVISGRVFINMHVNTTTSTELYYFGSNIRPQPARCQSMTRTNADLLSFGSLENNFIVNLIKIQKIYFKRMHLKMSSCLEN